MSMIKQRPVVETRTEHYALLQWWWKDEYVHDSEYKGRVNTAMEDAVRIACEQFDVTDDTTLCCQWEGVQIYGQDVTKVQAAGDQLGRTLGRFKHVVFIG